MASLPQTRCPGCRQFIPAMPDQEDADVQERAYHADTDDRWQLHDCPALEGVGKPGPSPVRAYRRERSREKGGKQRSRLHKHVCACPDGPPIRAAAIDLTHITCGRCGSWFTWSPTPSELFDDELAGRVPA